MTDKSGEEVESFGKRRGEGGISCRKLTEDNSRYGTGIFFFKQKTAYEVGTGDWSSDVCSSDLPALPVSV